MQFKNIVETLYDLSLEDRLEIMNLLEHNIADSRRDEIASNSKEAQQEFKQNKLQFSSSVEDLKK